MSDISHTTLSSDSLDEAADVFALAFENDPFIRYVLSHHGDAFLSKARELFRFTCEVRLDMGQPVIGTRDGERLTAVACITEPGEEGWPASFSEKVKRFNASIGPESAGRLERYSKLGKQYIPEEPHYHLIAIGAHPEYKGRGLGGALLEAVSEMSASHPESTGIRLECTNPVNIPLYEYFGYHQVAKEKLDGAIDLWYMFRPDRNEN